MLGDCATNGSMIRRVLPDQHPEYPELYCVECELVRRAGQISYNPQTKLVSYIDGGRPGYAGAAVFRCLYRAPDYQILADAAVTSELQRFITRDADFTNEALPLPPNFLEWSPGTTLAGNPIPESPAKVFFGAEVTYLWHQVPLIPFSTIYKTLGKCNDAQFDTSVGGGNLDPETALFIGWKPNRIRGGNRGVMFNITYKFLVKTGDPANTETQPTWNKIYCRTSGKWESVRVKGTGAKPYPTGDMNKLFQMV